MSERNLRIIIRIPSHAAQLITSCPFFLIMAILRQFGKIYGIINFTLKFRRYLTQKNTIEFPFLYVCMEFRESLWGL